MRDRAASTELVNLAGIAEIARVRRPTVSNWRRRHEDFPAPVDEGPSGVVFRLADVEGWLQRHAKTYSPPSLELRLWNAFTAVRHRPDLEFLLMSAFEALGDVAASPAGSTDTQLDDTYEGAEFVRQVLDAAAEHGPSAVFEALISAQGRQARASWEHTTPPSVVACLVALAQPIGGVVYDPACGVGGLLLTAMKSSEPNAITRVVGQEHSGIPRHIASLRLAVHGVEADVTGDDSLTGAVSETVEADIVLVDPPLGQSWDPPEGADRWFAGVPAANDSEMAWLQNSINCLSPRGRAVQVSRAGLLFQGGRNGAIRRELVAQGCVHAIVGLPAGLYHPRTSIPLAIWVLGRPGTAPADVLFIDAGGLGRRVGGRTELRDADVDAIASTYQSWRSRREFADLPVPSRAVPVADLLADDACRLSASRWIVQSPDSSSHMERLRKASDGLNGALNRLREAETPGRLDIGTGAAATRVTVRDLVRSGHVRLIRSRRMGQLDGTGMTPLITPRGLRDDWTAVATSTVDPTAIGRDVERTRPGDVLISTAGSMRAAVDTEGGAVVAAPAHILRPDPDALEPLAFAALLTNTHNERHSMGTTLLYRDLLQLEIPLLDIASQRRLAEQLLQLLRLKRLAEEAARAAQRTARSAVDLVASGGPSPYLGSLDLSGRRTSS